MDGVEETVSSELAVGKQPEGKREGARYGQFQGENLKETHRRRAARGKEGENRGIFGYLRKAVC